MSKQAFVKTTDGFLAPIGEPVKAYLSMAAGDEIVLPVKMQRNPKYHRLAFSWLQSVFANQDKYTTFPQFRAALTVAAGYIKCTITNTRQGNLKCTQCGHVNSFNVEQATVVPESLSFEDMDEGEFHEWQKNCDRVLLESGVNTEIGFH